MSQKRNPDAKIEYFTPDEVLSGVRQIDAIGLDPATDPINPTGAKTFFTEADNGLERDWSGHGLVYCNPPFEEPWYKKIGNESAKGIEMVALVMAVPTTVYFQQDLMPHASAVCFWRGRLTFEGQRQSAGFGAELLYYGERSQAFRAAFKWNRKSGRHSRGGWIIVD